MKNQLAWVVLFCTVPAAASISDHEARIADFQREGNVPEQVQKYYMSTDPTPGCGDNANQEAAAPDYRVTRLEGSSGAESPYSNPVTFSYSSSYLVLKYCFMGTTHAGADRMIVDAVVIQADRVGTENHDGSIRPSKPDVFTRLRTLDPKIFAASWGS